MTAQAGIEMLLKVDTAASGGPTYTTVGGVQAKSIRMNTDVVNVTDGDATDRFRRLLGKGGERKISVQASGVFEGGTAAAKVIDYWSNTSIKSWQVIVPGLGTFVGTFQIASLDYSGPHDKEISFSIQLESASTITFTAE